MASPQIKRIWLALSVFSILFLIIFSFRYELLSTLFPGAPLMDLKSLSGLSGKDSWMNVYLNNKKIGYSHSVLLKTKKGFKEEEKIFMRMNIMGFTQDLAMDTSSNLHPDLSLDSFVFHLVSGIFEFKATGQMKKNNILTVETNLSGSLQKIDIPLKKTPFLTSELLYVVSRKSGLKEGDEFTYYIFDPSTLSQEKVLIRILGEDNLTYMGLSKKTTKLTINYKGSIETAWLDDTGDVVREEGLLGMTLEKTTKQEAYAGIPKNPGEDITQLASIPANKLIENPRNAYFLKVELSGIEFKNLSLNGGRQKLRGNILEISRERINPHMFSSFKVPPPDTGKFLKPEPFIESDNPEIKQLVNSIISENDRPFTRAYKVMEWVFKNLKKRPVLSVPDALATLKNKEGDCNEHAVLLAALARAAGIPAKIEAGLVYLNGRFYYHAWNLLYVGRWVTADAVFGQFPTDATHIRFVSGSPEAQLDLMPVVDKVHVKVLEEKSTRKTRRSS